MGVYARAEGLMHFGKCRKGICAGARRWSTFGKCRTSFLRSRAEDAAAEAARGLVTSCESDA